MEIARNVASAFAYAHATGVVRRDIKPENVMLHQGEAVVTDFGIAKAVTSAGSEKSLTQTGSSVGTPAYMSPEQASGTAELDGRSDVYSLACMLYEMLAGALPFPANSVQAMLVRHLMDPVPSERDARSEVPEALDQAIAHAMAKDPADRFASAAEFAQALHVGGTPPEVASVSRGGVIAKSVAVLPFVDMSPQRDQE